jgi:hypothetical protein
LSNTHNKLTLMSKLKLGRIIKWDCQK